MIKQTPKKSIRMKKHWRSRNKINTGSGRFSWKTDGTVKLPAIILQRFYNTYTTDFTKLLDDVKGVI